MFTSQPRDEKWQAEIDLHRGPILTHINRLLINLTKIRFSKTFDLEVQYLYSPEKNSLYYKYFYLFWPDPERLDPPQALQCLEYVADARGPADFSGEFSQLFNEPCQVQQ